MHLRALQRDFKSVLDSKGHSFKTQLSSCLKASQRKTKFTVHPPGEKRSIQESKKRGTQNVQHFNKTMLYTVQQVVYNTWTIWWDHQWPWDHKMISRAWEHSKAPCHLIGRNRPSVTLLFFYFLFFWPRAVYYTFPVSQSVIRTCVLHMFYYLFCVP